MEKEKRRNRNPVFQSRNDRHVFDAFRSLLSTCQLALFGNPVFRNGTPDF